MLHGLGWPCLTHRLHRTHHLKVTDTFMVTSTAFTFLAPVNPHSMSHHFPSPPELAGLNCALCRPFSVQCWLRIYHFQCECLQGSHPSSWLWISILGMSSTSRATAPTFLLSSWFTCPGVCWTFPPRCLPGPQRQPLSQKSILRAPTYAHKTFPKKKKKAVMTCLFLVMVPPFF